MFVTAIHRKRPEPNKSRSIQVLCGGDGEILNRLASLRASLPKASLQSTTLAACRDFKRFPISPIEKTPTSGVFSIGGDGGMPFMYTTASSPQTSILYRKLPFKSTFKTTLFKKQTTISRSFPVSRALQRPTVAQIIRHSSEFIFANLRKTIAKRQNNAHDSFCTMRTIYIAPISNIVSQCLIAQSKRKQHPQRS